MEDGVREVGPRHQSVGSQHLLTEFSFQNAKGSFDKPEYTIPPIDDEEGEEEAA